MVFWFCIPCLMLILYFIIIGIFFPKYRPWIKEAIRCFWDKLRGKKCEVGFDEKMRLKFANWLASKNKVKLAKFFYNKKNFEWTLIIVLIIFTGVTTLLFILLIQYLFFQSPCEVGDNCYIGPK